MSKEQLHEYIDRTLLTVGGGSWGAYEAFKYTSEFCRMLLPITGIISFAIYIGMNWTKIKSFFTGAKGSKKR
jgi:hypothetical protein